MDLHAAHDRPGPMEETPVPGNAYDRYHARNPVARYLMDQFLETVARLVRPLEIASVLDVGCGEGHLLAHLHVVKPEVRCTGIDISERIVEEARATYPALHFEVGNVYGLDLPDRSHDLVVAADLLQQLHDPQRALRELTRVSRRYVLLTVPREPLWRLMNMARLAYLDEWGSPPGHVQHYRRGDFLNMVRGHLRLIEVALPLPWVVVLGRKGTV